MLDSSGGFATVAAMGLRSADSPGLEWLYSTQLFGIKLGLEAPARLVREFAGFDPQRPPFAVIHVAGTNGKGSTCVFAERLLRGAGRRTGLFTSPHLVHFSERIRVDGVVIEAGRLERDLAELRAAVEGWETPPTFFELTLALALRHFVREGVKAAVLETGMGGRLDATNVLSKQVAVLTSIGMDHAQWLGGTLAQIAGEKAGILRPGVPALSAIQEPEVSAVIAAQAAELGSSLRWAEPLGAEWELGLSGAHQRANAALALAAVEALGVELDEAAKAEALAATRWPGRFERRAGGRLVLDGAHNEPAAKVLAAAWREQFGAEKALLLCGIVDKDACAILAQWRGIADEAWFVPVPSPRTADPAQLLAWWQELGGAGRTWDGLPPALEAARRDGRRMLVAGSLFLIGQATAWLDGGQPVRTTMQ